MTRTALPGYDSETREAATLGGQMTNAPPWGGGSVPAEHAEAVAAVPHRPSADDVLWELRQQQSLTKGYAGGAVGALIGAVIWGVITAATGYQIGWMAIGVGLLAGLGVRVCGKGVDPMFGFAGAFLALGGCVVGNLFFVCLALSSVAEVGFFEVLFALDFAAMTELMSLTFEPIDLLFYGLAAYEGYHVGFRRVA